LEEEKIVVFLAGKSKEKGIIAKWKKPHQQDETESSIKERSIDKADRIDRVEEPGINKRVGATKKKSID